MKKILPIVAIFDFILFDLVSKYFAHNLTAEKILIKDFLSFKLQKNDGIAFSIPIPTIWQIIISIIILIILIHIWRQQAGNLLLAWSMALIIGGAIGNMIERILFAEVTDFIAVMNFPVFNLADSFISLGAGLFILSELIQSKEDKNESSIKT